jgi:UPF0716 family protein affecting phage T7 exclusion
MGFLVWLIGIAAAVALAFVTLRFNLQKWVIMIATSVAGAAIVFGRGLGTEASPGNSGRVGRRSRNAVSQTVMCGAA